MILKDLKFFGKHADLLKKYSDNRNTAEQVVRNKIRSYKEGKDSEEDLILFDTYFKAFYMAATLGLKHNKKTKMDMTDSTKNATIFAEILGKNSEFIRNLYLYYLFVNTNKEKIDETIKKAFSPSLSAEEISNFSSDITEYACTGLEIINNLLLENRVIEDVLISINQMIV
jgi:hypothetical protein